MNGKIKVMDGNEAAAYASYAFTEVAAIYPITPSSPMAEMVDEWSFRGMKNIFGQPVKVVEMQSEAGAAGAMHGALATGSLAATYTASQGLLLMIPNIYKMAGELLPGVLHVSARSIATHALSIFGDHQDVMACRQTGAAMLVSANAQEAMDLGCVAHLAAIKSRVPFIHFFDGFRTSHEYEKVECIAYEDLNRLVDHKAIEEFRSRALNPEHPLIRGTAQNPDIYFQLREAANPFYDAVPAVVEKYMEEIRRLTGRSYRLFDYYGAPDAEYVIVAMGSVCDTIGETVDWLQARGEKVGLLRVRLYRPFSLKHFLDAIPQTVKKIAVLDRTKEPGSIGEPLYLDVSRAFYSACKNLWKGEMPVIVGGRYGLSSKDTRPAHIAAVYSNLKAAAPRDRFTIGIIDDVSNSSLPEPDMPDVTPAGTFSCKIWGLGSDGTVGANKTAVKIIGENTDLYVQGYFSYDSKKSGGTTISHLRFSRQPIRSRYLVYDCDYIACHNKSFIYHYDVLQGLKQGGIFVLNCPWTGQELEEKLPAAIKRELARKKADFYVIDATRIAGETGLGNRINMIMQGAFFQVAGIFPTDKAAALLKDAIEDMYGKKGEKIVEMNRAAVDRGMTGLVKVPVPAHWADARDEELPLKDEPDFVKRIQRPMSRHQGDSLPVSAFLGMEDGSAPPGTTAYEKRGIAVMVPQWQPDKCIQCNQCSLVCPHAVIRPFLLDESEEAQKPPLFITKKAVGRALENFTYRIQVSPLDCTGCGNCADICPAPGKALVMMPAEQEFEREADHWEFAINLKEKRNVMRVDTIKGSQFEKPLLEFNGACPGCGETPYVKLLTQLFGDRMIIANATGCSSIWAASHPSMAYTVNSQGRGPAWANSLFEDNAEYGYGMYLGVRQNREKLYSLMEEAMKADIEPGLKEAFAQWLENWEDGPRSREAADRVLAAMKNYTRGTNALLDQILQKKDYLVKPSIWIIGGDGWAYDIGFGGLDHVLASGADVNMLVLDTEVYSNTGGQASKATPCGAVAKFAAAGKRTRKKDLGLMAISYGDVYVAQVALGADMNQTIKAFAEAEIYRGPALIIAYSPCISHGIKTGMGTSIAEEKKAVECGYWQLYRYNPGREKAGENPLSLDSKEPVKAYRDFLDGEIRFTSLIKIAQEAAEDLFARGEAHARERYAALPKRQQQ